MAQSPGRGTDPFHSQQLVGDGPSLLSVANVVLRHWRLIVLVPLVFCITALAWALRREPEYVASASFLPEVEQAASSGLSGLASQLGVNMGASRSGESMEFYSELLKSRELLRATVLTEYDLTPDTAQVRRSGTLVDVYRPESQTAEGRIRSAIGRLRGDVSTTMMPRAGLIELQTTAPSGELAVQINRRMLQLLNEFNLQKRQSKTTAEREFIEERLSEAQAELREVEENLERFLETNRRYTASPQLSFEAARLERELELRQQVYMSLAQAYEQARVEEVRNTPVVTVVEQPEGSAVRRSRRLGWSGITGLVIGLILAAGAAFLQEVLTAQRRRRPEEFREFQDLRDDLLGGFVPAPFRKRRRLNPGGDQTRAVAGSDGAA